MRFLLPLLLLAACDSTEYPPPTALDAAFTTCDAPADCVIVDLGCCDHCNGGVSVAVRADQADTVRDQLSESCGNSTECTEMGCGALSATCDNGTCVTVQADL